MCHRICQISVYESFPFVRVGGRHRRVPSHLKLCDKPRLFYYSNYPSYLSIAWANSTKVLVYCTAFLLFTRLAPAAPKARPHGRTFLFALLKRTMRRTGPAEPPAPVKLFTQDRPRFLAPEQYDTSSSLCVLYCLRHVTSLLFVWMPCLFAYAGAFLLDSKKCTLLGRMHSYQSSNSAFQSR